MVAIISQSILPVFLSLALVSVSPSVKAQSPQVEPPTNILGCVEKDTLTGEEDLFPHKVEAFHSEFWSISYHNTYKILENKHVGVSYLLYQCGTEPPADLIDDHHFAIPVPLQDGIALTQTTYIPHIELLGKRTDITTYIGSPQWISSPCLNELILDDKVEIVDGFNQTAVDEWVKAHPQSVIISNPWSDKTQAGRMIVSESAETASNKAVFEWHKAFAALYNLEHVANQNYDDAESNYDCVSQNANMIETDKVKPKILWGNWVNWFDSWSNTTTIGWQLGSCPNYYCEFAEHCSAEFMLPEPGMEGSLDCWGSPCMTDEEFKIFAQDADYWIYPSDNFNDVYGAKKDMMDQIPVVQNKLVFDTYASGPNTWFEQRMAEYDVVLQDMCVVVGTTPPGFDHKRKWLRNVFDEPLGELGVCTDIEAPLERQATKCALLDPVVVTVDAEIAEPSDSSSDASSSSDSADNTDTIPESSSAFARNVGTLGLVSVLLSLVL